MGKRAKSERGQNMLLFSEVSIFVLLCWGKLPPYSKNIDEKVAPSETKKKYSVGALLTN
jgi:hypothetical protein